MRTRAFNTGVSGMELTAAGRALVRAGCRWDVISFRRSFGISIQANAPVEELALRQALVADLTIPVDGAANPVHPMTTSATMIAQVIRSAIGFQGLLMSSDVPMMALAGSIGGRKRATSAAGAPLHSNDNAQWDALTATTASA
jgi:hypothetical protein